MSHSKLRFAPLLSALLSAGCSVMLDPAAIAPDAPAAPTGLVATAGNAMVTLSWDALVGDVAHVDVFVGTSADSLAQTAQAAGSATHVDVSGLTNGTLYYFAVAAVDSAGKGSPRSDIAAATVGGAAGAPFVQSSTPANGSVGVPPTSAVALAFSEAMNTASVEAAFSASPSIACSWSWSAGNTLATCNHAPALAPSSSYAVTLSNGATDTTGTPLASAYTLSFTTAASTETTPPTVTGSSPANLATGVPLATPISVTFSEQVDKASAQSAFAITSPGGHGAGTFTWTADGLTMTFDPAIGFAYGDTVTCRVSKAVKDLAGNFMSSDVGFSFTVVRQASLTLFSDAARDGTVWSVDGAFVIGLALYPGDNALNAYGRGFVSFDLGSLPASVTAITGATLGLYQESGVYSGAPYDSLGPLYAERVDYGPTLDASDLTLAALDAATYTLSTTATTEWKTVDVRPSAIAAWADRAVIGGRIQFRLRFANNTDNDLAGDTVALTSGNATANEPYLVVTYEYR